MTASLLIPPKARFFDASGAPLASGKLYSYQAGSTTPKFTYQNFTAGSGNQNTNPVILDSAGEANIWLDGNYKLILKDSNDVTQWTVDNVSSTTTGGNLYTTTGSVNAYLLTPTPALTEYATGTTYNVIFNISNTGPSTINISNIGTKSLVYPPSTALSSGNLVAGVIYQIVYDGTNFQVLNPTTVAASPPIEITMGLSASAPTGRLVINGDSLGSSTSGATYTGTTYQTLYAYWWNNVSDTYAPVSGGRGVSAAADFSANKKITMPNWSGYTPMGVGSNPAPTSAGMTVGANAVTSAGSVSTTVNAVTLSQANLPNVQLGTGFRSANNSNTTSAFFRGNQAASSGGGGVTTDANTASLECLTQALGSGTSFTPTASSSYTGNSTSVLQPSFGIYYYINY